MTSACCKGDPNSIDWVQAGDKDRGVEGGGRLATEQEASDLAVKEFTRRKLGQTRSVEEAWQDTDRQQASRRKRASARQGSRRAELQPGVQPAPSVRPTARCDARPLATSRNHTCRARLSRHSTLPASRTPAAPGP